MTTLKGKVVLVTGANRGIGAALVDALLEAGAAKVYATARREGSLGWEEDARVVGLELDVRDAAACARVAELAADVDVLINNAGTLRSFDLLAGDDDALEVDMDTNFHGVLRMARAFAPRLERAEGAAIVNVLTMLSVAAMPAMGGYSASKAAAWSLTMSLRATLASRGVAVHGVYPGAVDTDMLEGVEMPKASPVDVARAIVAGVEAGHEDIAPDAMSEQLWGLFLRDPKAVERQFASM
jgi:NAD(P)-dependent dehydrogenase (short-subunit alcohol dehydrogenase family)